MVAGFSTEPAGESGALAITATRIGFPAFVLLNLLAGFRSFRLQPKELELISRAIAHSNRIGLQAAPLVTQKSEEGWETPLSQWHAELGVRVAEGEPFSAVYRVARLEALLGKRWRILACRTNTAGTRVTRLAAITGPLLVSTPKSAQVARPSVNRLYIDREIARVSLLRRVLNACGKKLKVVSSAAR